ncbi:hypothetical protein PPL_00176 [Heterostelium album PN500]|uniref:Uncharacterized protein n=1 Tax=Heterostelium pallidum (strain ATCC 26659 / Pp 5 / PN500) TaxID=670386 RepID=D3AVR1_HETP5|nr:hypothetical protein PPL_00176 [Heterostelium album PN500]EFA86384.1 hypothetical protein PPL_00176 [Heterostelium album PN500]|eukprot:XP_020438489.1 hypothetical protein PPL_00176 [Heterostelium album PN500]
MQSSEQKQNYGWGAWNADWKIWWGNMLGNDSLKQSGVEQRKQFTNKAPLQKTKSFEDSTKLGVNGGKVSGNYHSVNHVVQNPIIPDYKRPTYERTKYDDEILLQEQEKLKTGSGQA